mmetsp:Transcript_1585/g.2896  ORF Transcript_1585/g.2896 Transcript_1585/m.2896 type:complete len:81 (+) Transcript_1585:3641-3883(+)
MHINTCSLECKTSGDSIQTACISFIIATTHVYLFTFISICAFTSGSESMNMFYNDYYLSKFSVFRFSDRSRLLVTMKEER